MSIGTASTVNTSADTGRDARARTLNSWAGRSLVTIGVVHVVLFTVKTWSRWGGWIGGDLHGTTAIQDPANATSLTEFWALPGSFAVPLIVLGLLLCRMARTDQRVPGYVGWILGAWVLLGGWILEPSGFPLGLVPAALLLLAERASARTARPAAVSGRPTAP